jgi:hypothetical protein
MAKSPMRWMMKWKPVGDSLTMNNGVQPRRWMLDEAGELSDGELGSDTLENLYWVKYLY